MNSVTEVIQAIDIGKPSDNSSEDQTPADYLNEEGLLVCGKCDSPKQIKMRFPGQDEPFIARVACECQKREEKERIEEEARREAAAKTSRRRGECFPTSGIYRECTFENDDGTSPQISNICQRFASTFDAKDPNGLLLWGGVGMGKTFMSAAIANRVIDRGFSALQTDIGYIANIMESSFENRRRNLDKILNYDLLLIEDLGAQRCTGYMMEHVYAVIDGRYKAGKPMVITTNFSLHHISHVEEGDPWSRIFDRILERCYPVEVKGRNRRRENAMKMRDDMAQRLGLC